MPTGASYRYILLIINTMSTVRQGRPEISNPMSGGHTKGGRGSVVSKATIAIGMVILMSVLFVITQRNSETTISIQSDHEIVIKADTESDVSIKRDPQHQVIKSKNKSRGPSAKRQTLVLETKHGRLKIALRPDLSSESIDYIQKVLVDGCSKCEFYRAERRGNILQGILANKRVPPLEVLGKCPEGAEEPKKCPSHHKECACHGPIMTKGMVGWAGGGGGPHFFINTHPKPATWWETQHTVWGELQDDKSFAVVDHIYTLPATKKRMTYLDERLPFTAKLIEDKVDD